jgi:hypothetical protein
VSGPFVNDLFKVDPVAGAQVAEIVVVDEIVPVGQGVEFQSS